MIQEENGRSRRLLYRRRGLLPDDESDGTDQIEDKSQRNSFTRYRKRTNVDKDTALVPTRSLSKQSHGSDIRDNGEESEKETLNLRQRSSRLRQKQEQTSDEEHKGEATVSNLKTKVSRRRQERQEPEEDDEDEEDEETEHVRRSSRKRRPVCGRFTNIV